MLQPASPPLPSAPWPARAVLWSGVGWYLLLGLAFAGFSAAGDRLLMAVLSQPAEAQASVVVRQRAGVAALLFLLVAGVMWHRRRAVSSFLADAWRYRGRLVQPVPAPDRWVLAGITLLLAVSAAWFLDQPMRTDEAGTFIDFHDANPLAIPARLQTTNNHPLHSLLLRLSVGVLGPTAWASRLPAYLCMLAVPTLLYLNGRRYGTRSVGLVAAGLAVGLGGVTDLATNARGYPLLLVCTLCLFLTLPALAAAPRARRNATAWSIAVLATAAGLATIPLMLYPAAAAVLTLLGLRWWPKRRRPRREVRSRDTPGGRAAWRRGTTRSVLTPGLTAASVTILLAGTFYAPAVLTPRPTAAFTDDRSGVLADNTESRWGTLVPRVVRTVHEAADRWLRGLPEALDAGLHDIGSAWAFLLPALAGGTLALLRGSPAVLPWLLLPAVVAGVTLLSGVILPPWSLVLLMPAVLLLAAHLAWSWRPVAAGAFALLLALTGQASLHLAGTYPTLPDRGRYVGYRDAPQAADVLLELGVTPQTPLHVPQVLWPPLLFELLQQQPGVWGSIHPAAPLPLAHEPVEPTLVVLSPLSPPLAELVVAGEGRTLIVEPVAELEGSRIVRVTSVPAP